MIKEHLFTISDPDAWRKYLPEQRSVFGSLGYARICYAFRNMSPRLYVLASAESAISYPLLFRSLEDLPFRGEVVGRWDSVTPDFTGPVASGIDTELHAAFPAFRDARFKSEGVIAEFGHLHPWSEAKTILKDGCDYNRDIVWVDTHVSPENLWHEHVAPACRRSIKRAEREAVRVFTASNEDHVREFHRLYTHTMSRNQAVSPYYFSYEFFRAFREELPENSRFFLAEYRDQIVSGCLCLHDDSNAFYFLAGTDVAFQHVRPANAVIWALIRWAHSEGKARLILGAGYRPDDGVFHFKSNFSRLRQPFFIYKRIHLRHDYATLEQRYREFSGLTAEEINYFPVYRHCSSASEVPKSGLALAETKWEPAQRSNVTTVVSG